MPMPAKIGFIVGNYHQMKRARGNRGIAPWADVGLLGCVRLYRGDRQPKIAHTNKATMIANVPITIATSRGSLRAGRNGLKPTRVATLLAN